MKKIRRNIMIAAVAGGSVLGLAGVADAATDSATADPAALVGDATVVDGTTEIDDAERAERRAARQAAREAHREAIADVLGVSADELSTQLSEGATLASIAEANGVAVQDVVDAMVQIKTERIDQAIESGRITAEEAAERTAQLEERVQTRVEEGRPERGEGQGRRGGRGPAADTAVDAPADDAEG